MRIQEKPYKLSRDDYQCLSHLIMGKSTGGESSVVYDDKNEPEEDYKPGGYHRVQAKDLFHERYNVIQKVGWGHFSTVWLCKDQKFGTFVAMKVQKSAPNYTQAAYDEIEILSRIAKSTHNEDWMCSLQGYKGSLGDCVVGCFVVQLLNTFVHSGPNGDHVCMVFELLGVNLLEIIKVYNYKGVPPSLCQKIVQQVLVGLDYLHRICGIIHTDLKPENVLLQLSHEQFKEIILSGHLLNKIPETKDSAKEPLTPPVEPDEAKQRKIDKRKRYRQRKKEKEKEKKRETTEITNKKTRKRNRTSAAQAGVRQSLPPEHSSEVSSEEDKRPPSALDFSVKIADLGNGCWVTYHHSDLIQTRQYRSPEVILGITYNERADLWSLACMLFELLTGDLLFEPKSDVSFDKNDDHLAQMIETLGVPDLDWALSGRYSKQFFNKYGILKKIKELKVWLLQDVLMEKYRVRPEEAKELSEFLKLMLKFQPERRATAAECLQHPWLRRELGEIRMSEREHQAVVQSMDNAKLERLAKLECGETVTSPEIPMPYCDDADVETVQYLDESFFTEDEEQGYQENEEYHEEMIRVIEGLR